MKVVHTDGNNKDFYEICVKLDKSLNDNAPGRKEAGMNSLKDIENIKDAFLLYKRGKPIGSACLWQHDEKGCELIRVFIEEKYRGMEYIQKLIKKVEKLAKSKGYKSIFLRTYSTTPYAVRAYQKLGFSHVSASQIKYEDKFPSTHAVAKLRVFMEKDLK